MPGCSRVYGILAGYEEQNDHYTLRSDPVFKVIASRSSASDDLASQPTLSRFGAASLPAGLQWTNRDALSRSIPGSSAADAAD